MWRMTLAILLFQALGLFHVIPARAETPEMWRCTRPDGSEIYTNKSGAGEDCKEYVPAARLGVLPPGATPTVPPMEGGAPLEQRLAPAASERRPDERRGPGQISFETFRMLDTGMTETEVLVRAGPPRHTFRLSIGTVVWAYLNDDWVVEVTFSGGRVADISRYRPRP